MNEIFTVSQVVLVEILHIDSKKHRLGLALAKTKKLDQVKYEKTAAS